MDLIQAKEVSIETQNGDSATYVIGKFPADPGLELAVEVGCIAAELASNKADPSRIVATINKAIAYSEAITKDGGRIRLNTQGLRDNHLQDWETKLALFIEIAKYNISFFQTGRPSSYLTSMMQGFASLNQKTSTA